MIACLASYRSIFVKQDASAPSARTSPNSGSSAKRFLSLRNFFKTLLPQARSTRARISDQDDETNKYLAQNGKKPSPYDHDGERTESRTHIIPLPQIHVAKDFRALSNPAAGEA
ncbi:hypothetical protein DSL72_008523 [Monilinia vaccinii-corymbosi]|uniref:Uncharacterized protein n=1 Tax=Monilinia vaccinii-corymbosi TaxID=61207 RepID=A0A8A3PKW2_9HELO|nr:hypothetical protein DSL72_008523 [Monilinia vaccinii-corymbosi]